MRNFGITLTIVTICLGIILLTVGKMVHAGDLFVLSKTIGVEPEIKNSGEVTDPQIDFTNPILKDPQLKLEKVADGLDFSTSMAFLGPNHIIVLERTKGTVQSIVNGSIQKDALLDVPVNHVNGRGMLGVATAGDKNSDRTFVFLYFTLSSTSEDSYNLTEELGNRLYRYELNENKLVNPKLLLNIPAFSTRGDGGHNGGKLLIGPDQYLYLTVGDLRERATMAQNNRSGLPPDGTSVIYRLTQDGDPAPGNPFGNITSASKFYAYGIRNSFGIDFDPVTGKLWDTENGPEYGDEINLVEPGFNSGWKRQMGFSVNSFYPDEFTNIGTSGNTGKYSDPEFVWNLPVAPTALKFLTSDKLGTQYRNDMFIGDALYGNIYHFDLKKNRTNLAIYTPLADKIADNMGELEGIVFGQGLGRITDLVVGPDGYLYILTNNMDLQGAILRIVPVTKS